MTQENIKKQIKFIKENCDDYIREVHDYMVKDNWTWCGSSVPPAESEIKQTLFDLLSHIQRGIQSTATGGFNVCRNEDENRIECYYGHESSKKMGLTFFADGSTMCNATVLNFINYICNENKVLNKAYLKEMLTKWEGHQKD